MEINLIVGLSLLCAAGFFLVWLLRRDLREKIERPKYQFQDYVRHYDQHCHDEEHTKEDVSSLEQPNLKKDKQA